MPTCPTHPGVPLGPKKKGWYCEDCDQSVLSYDQHPREASEDPASSPRAGTPTATTPLDLEALPFPVAHPLAFARDPALGPTERLNNAIFAAYQAMRTAALLLLADYLDVAASDRALEGAIRGLRMPHWGGVDGAREQAGPVLERPLRRAAHALPRAGGGLAARRHGAGRRRTATPARGPARHAGPRP